MHSVPVLLRQVPGKRITALLGHTVGGSVTVVCRNPDRCDRGPSHLRRDPCPITELVGAWSWAPLGPQGECPQ